MRGLLFALAFLLTPTGCWRRYDPNWEHVVTPEGQRGYALECSHTIDCVQLAGELCTHGYTIQSLGSEHAYDPQEQQGENASATLMKRWPADMGRSVRYAVITCGTQPTSGPPKITVTPNQPPKPAPQKASSYSSGLEDE